MFFKIDALKNFALFTAKHLCWSLFLVKLIESRDKTCSKRKNLVSINSLGGKTELINNYVTLKLPHHHTSLRMITRSTLHYLALDTDTPFIIYRICSNKRRASKPRPLISATSMGIYIEISTSPLISAAPLNAGLIRIVTIFY